MWGSELSVRGLTRAANHSCAICLNGRFGTGVHVICLQPRASSVAATATFHMQPRVCKQCCSSPYCIHETPIFFYFLHPLIFAMPMRSFSPPHRANPRHDGTKRANHHSRRFPLRGAAKTMAGQCLAQECQISTRPPRASFFP